MTPPIIIYDYALSPYGQKVRLALTVAGIPFRQCEQPMVLPRPVLAELGITHRRIPLLAVGKDIFCDSSCAISAIEKLSDKLLASPSDKAYETYGDAIVSALLRSFPVESFQEIKADRATIFPVITRPDYATLRPSAFSELKSLFDNIEHEMLNEKPYINGDEISIADINIMFAVKWALVDLAFGQMEGFRKQDIPAIHNWISHVRVPEPTQVSAQEASELQMRSLYLIPYYAQLPFEPQDIPVGSEAVVETVDATPGAHPQYGVLIGTTRSEVILELQNGLRLHFPKRGYIIRRKDVFEASI